jgi:hypothetical protein
MHHCLHVVMVTAWSQDARMAASVPSVCVILPRSGRTSLWAVTLLSTHLRHPEAALWLVMMIIWMLLISYEEWCFRFVWYLIECITKIFRRREHEEEGMRVGTSKHGSVLACCHDNPWGLRHHHFKVWTTQTCCCFVLERRGNLSVSCLSSWVHSLCRLSFTCVLLWHLIHGLRPYKHCIHLGSSILLQHR